MGRSDVRGRDQKIDALKCLAIVLVVIGHAIVYNSLFSEPSPTRVMIGTQWIERAALDSIWLNVVYSFHMPLFAFLSAYVLFGRERSPLRLVGKRALGLMLPFVVWTTVTYLIGASRTWAGLLDFVGHALLYPQTPGAPWFLYALFGCFVIFAIIRAARGRDRALLVSAVIVASLIVVPIPQGDIFGVFDIAWLYPFFVMGYLFAKHAERIAERRRTLLIGGVLVWAALLPVIWPVLVPEVNWWYPALREWLHAHGLIGGVVALYAARYLCAAAAVTAVFHLYDHVRGSFLSWQAWVGRRTLGIYVTQPIILAFASAHISRNALVLAVFTLAASLAATLTLEQTRFTRLVFLGQARSRSRQPAVE